ncbi:LysR family transcriptional regulator [Crossiella cryophila]|uniref:DNA-binding transcriptional LysR family regulator n=1 Tax=Crossiella cryophila TaxID=43355 RepID=A0A7W7CDS1_9PSEU|nr:LysR family transcriptional regulator [Crossiella cryophila]MBB4677943.1 DNA-binding transcriptional LysR family regulator [Crossiella cryophila]
MADVDTRLLRYFIAVAEHLSFTAAAKTLYLAQPSLSRQIRQLESRLDVELFQRSSTEVRLTAAGTALLAAARTHLTEWEHTQRLVRSAAAAERGALRVGFVATGWGPLARQARTLLSQRHPGKIEPKRLDWGGEPQALREGAVDIAFLWLPADTTGLHVEPVATEARWAALARTHPLADKDSVTIGDLREDPVMWTRRAPSAWVDWWAVNPRPDGSTPRWGPENDNVEEMLEGVATGAAICISPESMARFYTHPELTWLPITDIDPLRIALAWPRERADPLLHAFVRAVLDSLGQGQSV